MRRAKCVWLRKGSRLTGCFEQIVAQSVELSAQRGELDVEQLALPLADPERHNTKSTLLRSINATAAFGYIRCRVQAAIMGNASTTDEVMIWTNMEVYPMLLEIMPSWN